MTRSRTRPTLASSLAGFAIVAALGGLGCNLADAKRAPWASGENENEREEVATPVVVSTIQLGGIEASLSAASTIEAERMVTVHAESTGRILKLTIEEGDTLAKGTQIARIKYDAQAAGLDRASAQLERAKADLDTVERLFAQGVASKDELSAARGTHRQALLDVKDSRREVRNTVVKAPFSGTVTERFVSEGAFVSAGAQLLSITDMGTLVARVYVPEKELDRIRIGQKAKVVGKAARGRQAEGVVQRIAPIVDATTGTVKVTVALPEPEGDRGFVPGMYAEVTLTTEKRDRVALVPKRALIYDDEQAFVFVIEGDRAKRVKLQLGLQSDEVAEVSKGIEVGDEVVTSGQAGLKDGGLIRLVDPSGEPIEGDGERGEDLADRGSASAAGGP